MATSWTDATVTTSNHTLGNTMRFVDADPLADGAGGVDFLNTFSSENPFAFTASANPIQFSATTREEP